MKTELGIVPWGFCPDCLERRAAVEDFERIELGAGAVLLQAHCPHRDVGAFGIIRPGVPLHWKLETPVDVVEWVEKLPDRVDMLKRHIASVDNARQQQTDQKKH